MNLPKYFLIMSIHYMDSSMDNACLQARIFELERDLNTLRTQNDELIKERNNIFYKWTKEDFMSMLDTYLSDNDLQLDKGGKDKFWTLWYAEFNEHWSSLPCYQNMTILLNDIAIDHKEELFIDVNKPKKE